MAGAPKRSTATRKPRSTDGPAFRRAPARGKYDRTRTANEREKEQRGRLLDAAGQVFAEKGWADASVEAIVTRAGMSRRTFYEHFDDLRDCLLTFYRQATRRAFKAVELAVASAPPDPHERLQMGVLGFLGGIAAFPQVAHVIFRVVRAAGPEFEAAHDQSMERFARLFHEGVAAAHAVGRTELPADDVRVFALVSAMEAVAMRYLVSGDAARAIEAVPILVDMVERTFGARRA